MKQTIIACFITAAACIAFSIIFSIATRQKIEDHSKKFMDLEVKDNQVQASERILTERLQSLFIQYQQAQSRIDSLRVIVGQAGSRLIGYEKQLKEIRAGMKATHYQDSSKATIIKNLPK